MKSATAPRVFHGWRVLFTEPFTSRYGDLSGQVQRLKQELGDAPQFHYHPTTKLFRAVFEAVYNLVPSDPERRDFLLDGDLAKFRRVKKNGLPKRYRLFFVFSTKARVIIFLYLNDEHTLRNQGSSNDPYAVFSRMVSRGEIGAHFEENFKRWRAQHPAP
ncbi:MAG: type II toxin-antitoxin system YhaV family toxin [Candidatus Dormibacteria bacterium]